MNKNQSFTCVTVVFFVISLISCKKDGLNSASAKKIQYRWERFSRSTATDYLDGRTINWTTRTASPNTYLEFSSDGYFYDVYINGSNTKYLYKVDGNKILYLFAGGSSRPTTPQYTDTSFINYVDDNLLVLFYRKYFVSGAYSYINLGIDSLKK